MKALSLLLLALFPAIIGSAGCATVKSCARLGFYEDENDLARMYEEVGRPLVVAGHNVFLCGCMAEKDFPEMSIVKPVDKVKLAKPDNKYKPNPVCQGSRFTQPYRFGGKIIDRSFGGAVIARRFGGAIDGRETGGWAYGWVECYASGKSVIYRLLGMPGVNIKTFDGSKLKLMKN